MGRAAPPTPSRRMLFVDERGAGMRASWHAEAALVVLSLWRGEECIGTFRMSPRDAVRFAAFLEGHLAERTGEAGVDTVALPATSARHLAPASLCSRASAQEQQHDDGGQHQ